jgi:hypothetical protein
MMIVLVLVQMERWSVLLHIRDDQTHTAHCTQHTTIQASINRNSTMVSTHIRSAEGRKTDTHTDKKPEYRKFSTVRLRTSFESLTTGKSGDLSLVASPLFSPGILNKYYWGYSLRAFILSPPRAVHSIPHSYSNRLRHASHQHLPIVLVPRTGYLSTWVPSTVYLSTDHDWERIARIYPLERSREGINWNPSISRSGKSSSQFPLIVTR